MPPSPAGPIGCRYRNLAGTKWQSERREHRNPFCTQSLSAEIGVVFARKPSVRRMGRGSRKGLKRMRSLISRMLERTEGTGAVKFRFVFLYPCGMPCITIPCKENVREPEEKRRAALRPIFPVISSLFARSSTKAILRQSFPASRVPSSYTQKETRLSFFRASVPAPCSAPWRQSFPSS